MIIFLQYLVHKLDGHSVAIQALSSVILVLITAYYAYITRTAVVESEKSRKDARLPILELKIDGPIGEGGRSKKYYIVLTMKNTGSGPAIDASYKFPDGQENKIGNIGVGNEYQITIDFELEELNKINKIPEEQCVIIIEYKDIFSRLITTNAYIFQTELDGFIVTKWYLDLPTNRMMSMIKRLIQRVKNNPIF